MTLTKSWLQKQITDLEATRDEIPFGLDEDGNNTLAAFKAALAVEGQEPVISVIFKDGWPIPETVGIVAGSKKLPDGVHEFYTAPQPLTTSERSELENYRNAQQVVPGELSNKSFEYIANKFQVRISDAQWILVGWNARRAAMLQGKAEPVTATDNTAQQFEALATVKHYTGEKYPTLKFAQDEWFIIGNRDNAQELADAINALATSAGSGKS